MGPPGGRRGFITKRRGEGQRFFLGRLTKEEERFIAAEFAAMAKSSSLRRPASLEIEEEERFHPANFAGW